jgi:V8-like Glu-specific endopeptidase
VTGPSPYPYSAVGFIDSRLSPTRGAKCTGALIGRRAVATAGHCVYSRGTRAFIRGSTFTPSQYEAKGAGVAPFGSSEMAYYAVQSGW